MGLGQCQLLPLAPSSFCPLPHCRQAELGPGLALQSLPGCGATDQVVGAEEGSPGPYGLGLVAEAGRQQCRL